MSGSVADRNSGSGLTNPQAALMAAATFCAPVSTSDAEDVTRIADKFLDWLDASDDSLQRGIGLDD